MEATTFFDYLDLKDCKEAENKILYLSKIGELASNWGFEPP